MKTLRKVLGIVLSLMIIISMFVPMVSADIGIDGPHFEHRDFNIFANVSGVKTQINDVDLVGEAGNELLVEFSAAMRDPSDDSYSVPQSLGCDFVMNYRNINNEIEHKVVTLALQKGATDSGNWTSYSADLKLFEDLDDAYDCVIEIQAIRFDHDNGANDILADTGSWVIIYNKADVTNSYGVNMIEAGENVADAAATVSDLRNVDTLAEIVDALAKVNGCTYEEDARFTVVKDGMEFETYYKNEPVFLDKIVSSNGEIVIKPYVGFTGEVSLLHVGNFNLFINNQEKTPVQGDILLVGENDGRYLKYTISAAMGTANWVNGEVVSSSIDKDIVTSLESDIEIKFTYEDGKEEVKSYKSSLTFVGKDTNEAGTKDWNQFEGEINLFENETPKDAIIEFTKVDFGFVTNECSDWSAAKGNELWIFGYAKDDTRYNYDISMKDIRLDPNDANVPNNAGTTVNDLTSVNTLRQIIEKFTPAMLGGFEFPENTSWLVLDENGNEVRHLGTDEWVILNGLVYNGEITLIPYYNDDGNNDDPNNPNPPAGSFPVSFDIEFYRDGLIEGPQNEHFEFFTDGTETFGQIFERLKEENIDNFNRYGLTFKEFEFMGEPVNLTDKPTGEMGMSLRVKYENNFGLAQIYFYMEDGTPFAEHLNEAVIKENLTYKDILDNVQDILDMYEKEAAMYEGGFTGWRYEVFGEEVKPEDLGNLVTTYGETDQHTLNIIASYEKSPDVRVLYYIKDENGFGRVNEAYFPANDGDSFDSILANIEIEEGTGWVYDSNTRTKTYGSHISEILAVRDYSGYTPGIVFLTYVKNDENDEKRFIGTTDRLVIYINKTGLDGEQLKTDAAALAKAYDEEFGWSSSAFTKMDYQPAGTHGLNIPGIKQAIGFDVNAQYDEHLVLLHKPDFSEEYIIIEPIDDKEWIELYDEFGNKEIIWEGGEWEIDSATGKYRTSYPNGVWTDFKASYADGSKTVLFEYHYPGVTEDVNGHVAVVFSEEEFYSYGDPGEFMIYFVEEIVPEFKDIAGEFNSWNFDELDRDESRGYVLSVYPGENEPENPGGEGEEGSYAKGEVEFYVEENYRVIENFVIDTNEGMTVQDLFNLVNDAIPHAEELTFKGWKAYLTDGIGGYLEITSDLMNEVIDFNLEGLIFQFTALYEEKEYCEHEYEAVEGYEATLTKPGIRDHYECLKCDAKYYEEPMHGADNFTEKRMCNDDSVLETSPLQIQVGYIYYNEEGKKVLAADILPADSSRIFLDVFMEITGAADHYADPIGWYVMIDEEEAVITNENIEEFEDFLNAQITPDMAGMEVYVMALYEELETCECFKLIEWVDGKEPTATEDGHLDYAQCQGCGLKYYVVDREDIPYFVNVITFENMDEIKLNKLVTIVPSEDGKAEAKVEDTLVSSAIEEVLNSEETQIVIDVTPAVEETNQQVTSITLSEEAIDQIIEANENTEEELTVVIPLEDVIIVLDVQTLEAINEGEGSKTLEIEIKKTADDLNEKQKEALNGKKTHSLVTAVWVDENGEKISDFKGGSVIAILPEFEAEEGKELTDYIVLYISDEGKFERMPTFVKDGKLAYSTGHFSDYVVVSLEDADDLAPENGNNTPDTGDETNLALYSVILLISTAAFVLVSKKRRYN